MLHNLPELEFGCLIPSIGHKLNVNRKILSARRYLIENESNHSERQIFVARWKFKPKNTIMAL